MQENRKKGLRKEGHMKERQKEWKIQVQPF